MKIRAFITFGLQALLILYLFVPLPISAASLSWEAEKPVWETNDRIDEVASENLLADPVNTANETSYTISVDAGPDQSLCGGSVTLTARISGSSACTGGNTDVDFEWSSGQRTQSITVDRSGTYRITVTDCNGEHYRDEVEVSSGCNLTIDAGPDQKLCGGSATLSVDIINGDDCRESDLHYEWSSGQEERTITVTRAGTYRITVTDCEGDIHRDEIIVTEGGAASISASATGKITCNGSSIVMLLTSGSGFNSYEWTGPNGFTSSISNPMVFTPGTYTVIGRTNDGCEATTTVLVESDDVPNAVASNDGPITCTRQNITLNASGGGSYQWSGPGNFSSSSSNPTVSEPGTYNVVITGSNGCTATASTVVTGSCDQIPSIGDVVFNDLDQDGIQDAGEPGVSGVRVELISAGPDGQFHTGDDFVVDRDVTDVNGNYSFEEVAPGQYCIEVLASTIPLDYVFSPANAGGDDVDSDADALGKIPPFTVTAGQPDDLSFDAGVYEDTPELPSIGDLVFEDLDQDGVQDPNEPGVSGVRVELISAGPDGQFHTGDDRVVDRDVTDANGKYQFDEVEPGQYCIEVLPSTIPLDYVFSPANRGGDAVDSDADALGKIPAFTVTAGQPDDLSFDAGIFEEIPPLPSIGDLVFDDLDQDGVQDPNEPGVSGVRVELISAGPDGQFHTGDDRVVDRDVTDANGEYQFDEVEPGQYCIEVLQNTIPFGYVFTRANAGGDTVDSDADATGKIPAFTVTQGQPDDLSFDAGIYEGSPQGTTNIGDLVFEDLNQDGIQDPNEPGVSGVRVELISAGPDGQFHTGDDLVVDRDITDSNGIYGFEDVEPGQYCIEVLENTIPFGYVFTRANAGGDTVDSDADATGKIPSFTVTPGQSDDLSFDAGIHEDAPQGATTIGDLVFDDLDQDGIQDPNEPGVSGVRVELLAPGPDGQFHTGDDFVVDRDVTDPNGIYGFEDVEPGEYCIQILANTIPSNYVFTTPNAGGENVDSDADALGKIPAFTVTPGQDDLSFDAGIHEETATLPNIGDLVFEDLDKDGIQDANEPGVPGVRVELLSPGPDGQFHTGDDMVVDRDVTDSNGIYGFEDVAPGEYCIQLLANTIPSDYVFTASNAGGDTVDSDADALGKIPAFTVTAGQADDLSFDAGIYEEVSIPQVSISDIIVNEEDGTAMLEVCLDQVATEFIYVQYRTTTATAVNVEDYVDQSGYAFIREGEQCTEVIFDIVDDERPESDEEFLVILTDPYNTEIADGEGKVIILDTDSPENVECPDVVAYEEDGNIVVGGLVAPIEIVQIFNSSFDVVFRCMNNCDPVETVENLPDGDYLVKINCYSITWGLLCTEEIKVTVGKECEGNVTSGGRLGGEETNCGSYNPSIITNDLDANGGNTANAVEYMWLSSTVDCPSEETDAIPGATGATYDPGPITQTTYYLRCSRRVGCTVWVESNCIVKDVYCSGTEGGGGATIESSNGGGLRAPIGTPSTGLTRQTDRPATAGKVLTGTTGINIYPNPVSDILKVDLSTLAGHSGTVQLSNQIGQIVKTIDLSEIDASAVQIPVGSLANGLYHLTIVSEGQLVTTEKVIVQQ